MKQRGSALIISLMLIATVGAAAFGIAKLLYADTSIATTYENGAVAYYAAESGIEEGFLRYKYNMNAEVPYTNWALNDTKVFRTNLTATSNPVDYAAGVGIGGATTVASATNQYYDLRMGYLGTYDNVTKTYKPFFFHDVVNDNGMATSDVFNASYDTGDYSFLRIPKDEARTFDLSNVDLSGSNALAVGFKFLGVSDGTSGGYTTLKECQAMAEVKFIVNGGTALAREYKAMTSFNPDTCGALVGIGASKLDRAEATFTGGGYKNSSGATFQTGNTDYYYSLNDIFRQTINKAGATILSTDKVTMTIKPLYYPADIHFSMMSCNANPGCATDKTKVVTGPYTYMASTGYYGGTTRTLKANIDRQSGTLYDLYDYVLYSGN